MKKKQQRTKYTPPEIKCQFQELYAAIQADFDQMSQAKQIQTEAEKRVAVERENVNSWDRMEFETLNTQMMQYKKTKDPWLFKIMWHDYLKKLTNQYLHRFIIKGLPVQARRLFLTDTIAEELQDVLYPILLQAIQDWNKDTSTHFTKDFAAFYEKAVEFNSGNLLRRFNSKCHANLTLQNLDFNSDEEVSRLLLEEPKFAEHFGNCFGLDNILMKGHIETFVRTRLSKEEAQLFRLLYHEQTTVNEIARAFKIARMTVYRRRERIQNLWLAYEQETLAD